MALRFENNQERKRSAAKNKRGRNLAFYAAVGLCVGAAVLTAVVNSGDQGTAKGGSAPSPVQQEQPPAVDSFFDDSVPVEEAVADTWYVSDITASAADVSAEIKATPPAQTTTSAAPVRQTGSTSAPTATAPSTAPAVPATVSFRMPVGGEITCGYSGNELVFFSTMCDWRVHNGVDISGEAGQEVLACADGTVEAFVEDMLFGHTAIIRHADDSVMYYCGLSDTQMVSAGLNVKAGDVIGYIGEVPCELDDGPHVHITLMKDGQIIDPATVIGA